MKREEEWEAPHHSGRELYMRATSSIYELQDSQDIQVNEISLSEQVAYDRNQSTHNLQELDVSLGSDISLSRQANFQKHIFQSHSPTRQMRGDQDAELQICETSKIQGKQIGLNNLNQGGSEVKMNSLLGLLNLNQSTNRLAQHQQQQALYLNSSSFNNINNSVPSQRPPYEESYFQSNHPFGSERLDLNHINLQSTRRYTSNINEDSSNTFRGGNGIEEKSSNFNFTSIRNQKDSERSCRPSTTLLKIDDTNGEKRQAPPLQVEKRVKGLNTAWTRRGFNILQKIAEFRRIILSHSDLKKFKKLKPIEFEMIGDKTSDFDYYKYNDLLESCVRNENQIRFVLNLLLTVYTILISLPPIKKLKYSALLKLKKLYSAYQKLFKVILILRISLGNQNTFPLTTKSSNLLAQFSRVFMGVSVDVLKPDSRIKFFWDILMLILTWVNVLLSPLIFSFSDFAIEDQILLILQISCVLFAMDIIVHLNTAFFDQGIIQESRSQIIYKYAKGFMLIDLLTFMCLLQALNTLNSYLILPLFLRVIKVASIQTSLEEILQPSELATLIIRVANVFQLAFIIAHSSSCIFHWVASVQYKDIPEDQWEFIKTWLSVNGLLNNSWNIISLLVFVTDHIRMTIGYGDITPQSINEKIFTIIFAIASTASFAYSINTISQVITDAKKKQELYNERMKSLNLLMVNRDIDKHLQMRVRKYMEYLQYSDENVSSSSKDLECLPQSIKQDVQIDMYGQMIQRLKLFHLNFSQSAINRLALVVVEQSFGPGEDIFKPQEISDSLYIVMSGRVEIYAPIKKVNGDESEINISCLEKGNIFGAEDFFYQRPRQNGAKAASLSQIIEISKQKLEQSLCQSDDDYEKFKMLMDMVRFAGTTRGLGIQCHFCQDYNHSFSECPNVTYAKKKQLIIAKWNNSSDHVRDFIPRKRIKSANSIATSSLLQRSVQIFIEFQQYNGHPRTEGFSESEFDDEMNDKIIHDHMNNPGFQNTDHQFEGSISSSIKSPQPLEHFQRLPTRNFKKQQGIVPIQSPLQQIYNFQIHSEQDSISKATYDIKMTPTVIKQLSPGNIDEYSLSQSRSPSSSHNIQQQIESSIEVYSKRINVPQSRYLQWLEMQKQTKDKSSVLRVDSLPQIGSSHLSESSKDQQLIRKRHLSNDQRQVSVSISVEKSATLTYQDFSKYDNPPSSVGVKITRRSSIGGETPEEFLQSTPTLKKFQNVVGNIVLKSAGKYVGKIEGDMQSSNQKDQDGTSNFQYIQSNNAPLSNNHGRINKQSAGVGDLAPIGVTGGGEDIEATIDVDSIRAIKAVNNWEIPVLRSFDVFKNFKQYFPNNNLSRILERINLSILGSQKKGARRKNMRKGSVLKKIEASYKMPSIDISPKKQQTKAFDPSSSESQISPFKKNTMHLSQNGLSSSRRYTAKVTQAISEHS